MRNLSIIIPTLNEEDYLEDTLKRVFQLKPPAYEVIVVDGGSNDLTMLVASRFLVRTISISQNNRSVQMNVGASVAQGELLCFLHADTLVPYNLTSLIEQSMQQPNLVLGGFISLMRGPKKVRYFTSSLNYLKTYLCPLIYHPYAYFFKGLRLIFGDQVMFCRKKDFRKINGFDKNVPIMEEADFCLRINMLGKIRQFPQKVYTSDRRVRELGFWKAHFIYFAVLILWAFGASPHWLKQLYKDIR